MDFGSSLFSIDSTYENGLDISSLFTPSTFESFQELTPCDPIIHIERDRKTRNCEIAKGDDELKNKRVRHRATEKQRRQEVTSLFKNLRYTLPSQYIKGRRSSSDHVLEAVNYITDLQKKIREITEKRDQIKNSITHSSSTGECSIRSLTSSNCDCVGGTHIDVVVRTCFIGIEIVASCCFRHESCLSSVLQLLYQEQCLNVVSCISTKLHQRFVHTIVSEVEKGIEVNFSELQEKIIKLGTS